MAKNTTKQEYMTEKHTKREKKIKVATKEYVRVRTEYAVRRSRNAVRTQSERSRYAPGLQVKSAATQAVTPGMPFTSGSSSPTTHNALPDRTLPPPSPQPSTTPSRDTATAIRFLTFVCSHDCLMLLDLA